MVYIDLEGLLQKGTYLQSNTPGIGKRATRSCLTSTLKQCH